MRTSTLLIALYLFLHSTPPPSLAADLDRPPNILFILADDVGREALGCYGGTSYRTPELDALAKSGIRYRQCYSMLVCHPTRVCLLTGRYPFRLGSPTRWGDFPREAEGHTVAHVMKKAGYATAIAGKWQLAMLKNDPDHPHRLGFDAYCLFGWHEGPRYFQPMIYENGSVRKDVQRRYGPDVYCDFLIDFMKRNRDKPFFAFYSMALCHAVTDDLDHPVPVGPQGRYESFHEMIEAMDVRVGSLVAALDKLHLRERTLVLYAADNGTPKEIYIDAKEGELVSEGFVTKMGDLTVRGGKTDFTDWGTRVPTIASWPGTIAPGQVVDDLMDFSDVLPTFAELGGATLPVGVSLDGHSFAGRMLGRPSYQPRPWVSSGRDRNYWVRTHRWKLYRDRRLFDMATDPFEVTPIGVAGQSPAAAAARKQLQAVLTSFEE